MINLQLFQIMKGEILPKFPYILLNITVGFYLNQGDRNKLAPSSLVLDEIYINIIYAYLRL